MLITLRDGSVYKIGLKEYNAFLAKFWADMNADSIALGGRLEKVRGRPRRWK